MKLFTVLFLTVVVVSFTAAVGATRRTAGPSSQTFRQYNSTIMTYQGQPQIAGWAVAPMVSRVLQTLWCPAASVFVLLTQGGELYTADVFGQTFNQLSNSQPLVLPTTKMAIKRDGATVVFVTLLGEIIRISQCIFSSSSSPNCYNALGFLVNRTKMMTVVKAISFTKNETLAIGTDAGFMFVKYSPTEVDIVLVPLTNATGAMSYTGNDFSAVWCNEFANASGPDVCYASSTNHLVTSNAWTTALVHVIVSGVETHFYRTPGIVDAQPAAFVLDEQRGALHMLNQQCDNILFGNGTFYRVEGFHGGLPQQNLTCGAHSVSGSGTIWMGSEQGAIVLDQNWNWKYFFGPRWLPGQGFDKGMNVSALAVGVTPSGDDVALVATDGGLSFIRHVKWTLQQKAQYMQTLRDARHNRHGLCTGVRLQRFGDISSWVEMHTANDGLWTSLYVASQAFRYAATKDPQAKKNAWGAFEGMQLLINATGQPGYPARSVRQANPCPSGWYNSPTKPGWCFMSDTSSDEIVGHLSIYPIVYDLVAETPWEKAAVAKTITNIVDYILENNFTLVDPITKKETTWGQWQPWRLNGDPDWYDDRGPNSNQIVTYLTHAYRITGSEKYLQAFNYLVNGNGYAENLVNLKITQPSDINYSDDELTYLPYLSFLLAEKMAGTNQSNPLYEQAKESVWLSITRTQWYVAKGRSSLWNAIFSGFSQRFSSSVNQQFVEDGKWCLETWPIQLVDWPVNNARRLDIIADPHRTRSGEQDLLTETMLPFDENPQLMWNSNPFRTQGGSGYQEVDPGPWLFPYWVGVYFGLWY